MGTILTAIIISALLANANLFASLFLNPIGLVVGGALAGADLFTGVKIQGRFKSANVPVLPVSHDRWPHPARGRKTASRPD